MCVCVCVRVGMDAMTNEEQKRQDFDAKKEYEIMSMHAYVHGMYV